MPGAAVLGLHPALRLYHELGLRPSDQGFHGKFTANPDLRAHWARRRCKVPRTGAGLRQSFLSVTFVLVTRLGVASSLVPQLSVLSVTTSAGDVNVNCRDTAGTGGLVALGGSPDRGGRPRVILV